MSSFSRTSWRRGTKVEMKFEGLQELVFELQKRNELVANKAKNAAARRGGHILAKEAQRIVRVDTRTLQDSIGLKVKSYKTANAAGGAQIRNSVAIVGPRVSGLKFNRVIRREIDKKFPTTVIAMPHKYAHLVSGGVKRHGIPTKRGNVIMHPGFPGKPFMELAARSSSSAVQSVMEKTLIKAIQGEESFADLVLSDG